MSRERLLDGKTYKFFVIMQGPLLRRGSESRVRYKCNVSPRSGGACMGELFVWVVWVLLKSEERELNRKMLTQEGFRHFFFFLYTNIFSYENCFLATLKLKWLKHDYFVFLCVCFQAEDGGGGGGGRGGEGKGVALNRRFEGLIHGPHLNQSANNFDLKKEAGQIY